MATVIADSLRLLAVTWVVAHGVIYDGLRIEVVGLLVPPSVDFPRSPHQRCAGRHWLPTWLPEQEPDQESITRR